MLNTENYKQFFVTALFLSSVSMNDLTDQDPKPVQHANDQTMACPKGGSLKQGFSKFLGFLAGRSPLTPKITIFSVLLLVYVTIFWLSVSYGTANSSLRTTGLEETEAGAVKTSQEFASSKIESLAKHITVLQSELRQLKDSASKKEENHESTVSSYGRGNKLSSYQSVPFLNYQDRKRILVTGGAGFVGSHLTDRLMLQGHEVIVADNFFTGRKRNVEHWIGHPNFELLNHDMINPLTIEVDQIYHLASPASPPHYMFNPVKTIKTNTMGTINMLGLAKRVKATILIASTSEVYGDPEVHPQDETYWGHVNPIGPRACYDEAKRTAETLAYAYAKQESVQVRVARIFNTYGPRMHMNDGRVVSNFILQALKGEAITTYGDGHQTRSFQYVSDLVTGLIRLMESNYTQPVNIGNPDEHSIKEFASKIRDTVHTQTKEEAISEIIHVSAVEDDPRQRKPDISLAKKVLNGWAPKVGINEGLEKTIEYFRRELQKNNYDLKAASSFDNIDDVSLSSVEK